MKKSALVGIVILLVTILFYWFQLRPSEARKSCAEEATTKAGYASKQNTLYRLCLTKKGMKPESLFAQ